MSARVTAMPAVQPKTVALLAAALLVAGCAAGDGRDGPGSGVDAGTGVPLEVGFVLDETAFGGVAPRDDMVAFDLVSADMDLDGDPDLLVNWHNLAHLELFENRDGGFELLSAPGADRAGLYENPGVADLYAPVDEALARAHAAGEPGVYVWHEPDRRGAWHFWVEPGADGDPVTVELRANGPLTALIDERFVPRAEEHGVALRIDEPLHFSARVAYVAAQLVVEAALPVFAGADFTSLGNRANLWKDDPHGIAWVDVRGSDAPDIFIVRGGLMGTLAPPFDAKIDRFFEYTGGDPRYTDARSVVPANYGRGRRVEWVDIDGDGVNELYVGNTGTPNALLAADPVGVYVDIAPQLGLDLAAGDTFVWLDVDGDGRDDLVAIEAEGFTVVYNHGDRTFERAAGADIGLRFPAGSRLDDDELFNALSLYVIDADGDGRLDLWLSGHGEQRGHALYRATGDGFEDVTAAFGLDAAPLANRIVFIDVDNDGYDDALSIGLIGPAGENLPGAVWLRNRAGERFTVEPADPAWGLREFSHAAAIDVDGDGRLDLAVADHRRVLLRNTARGGGVALRVQPRGLLNDPVGTVVTALYAGGRARAQRYGSTHVTRYSQGIAPLHFGIPPGESIERLEIRWPDGTRETRAVEAGERFIELRREEGS